MNTEATEVVVKCPGIRIELNEREMQQLWDELTRMRQYSDIHPSQVPLTSDIIDALHEEIG